MIYFATTRQNHGTIRRYLEGHGAPMVSRITPLCYEQIFATEELPPGAWCFADLELLSDAEREAAARIWQRLAERGCRLLNHPTRSLRRYDLLRLLHRQGINHFDVVRASDDTAPERFPVFLRGENDHRGRRSDLLKTPEELRDALDALRRSGEPLEGMLITEFCDTRDAEGLYRKYSAFIVGDAILARHLFFDRDWQVKLTREFTDELLGEERKYVETNPHELRLREIFAAAEISYGRIDYSLLAGEIQVWEINTNPTITFSGRRARRTAFPSPWMGALTKWHRSRSSPRPRAQLHADFAANLEPVWAALDPR